MRFIFLTRWITLASMAACALAVVVARSAPRPAMFRFESDPHSTVINGSILGLEHSRPWVFDTSTEAFSILPLPSGETLEWSAFSDWVDDRGERQVVGRWAAKRGKGTGSSLTAAGLARFSYPGGRALDRVMDVPLPASAVSWYPGVTPRVLYAALDGQVYECTFAAEGLSTRVPPVVKPLRWLEPSVQRRSPLVDSIVWPKTRLLGNRLLASVRSVESSGCYGSYRLWWLRLSPDGAGVAEAGPLSPDQPAGDDSVDEFAPSVATLPGGECLLAFLRQRARGPSGELFVVPLRIDRETGNPVVRRAEARMLAEDVRRFPAAFSPDGAGVYAVLRNRQERAEVRRFPVNGDVPRVARGG